MHRLLATFTALLSCSMRLAAADPVEALRSWTSIESIDLRELASGKIATASNASMNLDRGMATQTLFMVDAPAAKTLQALLDFDATTHPELNVFQRQTFRGERDSAFDKLCLDPKLAASTALIRALGDPGAIQLSKTEIPLIPKERTAATVQQFLSDILKQRWSRFAQHGDLGGVATFDAGTEMRTLLAEEPKVAAHFASLLAPTKVEGAPGSPRFFYWELSNVDSKSAVQLGAVYATESADRRQVLDITCYSSGGYLVAVTLYELLPITLDGKEHTLVWQGSFVSATGLAGGLGLKRKIGSRMMLSQVEKWAQIFRQDAQKAAQ